MNKASWLRARGHLPINHLLTPHSHPTYPQCQKPLTQSEFHSCSLSPLPFSFPIFLPFVSCLLPYLPPLPHCLTVLSLSLSLLQSAGYTLWHHFVFLSVSSTLFSRLYLFLLLSLGAVHFNSLSSVLFLAFLPLCLLRSGLPAASSGACKRTKTAVWVVKSVALRVWARAHEMVVSLRRKRAARFALHDNLGNWFIVFIPHRLLQLKNMWWAKKV